MNLKFALNRCVCGGKAMKFLNNPTGNEFLEESL